MKSIKTNSSIIPHEQKCGAYIKPLIGKGIDPGRCNKPDDMSVMRKNVGIEKLKGFK